MKVSDAVITTLRLQAKAVQDEFDMAVAFHEAWKPAAYNDALHRRMSNCYAGQTFRMIRMALRREMMLALMRLWGKSKGEVRMDVIAASVRRPEVTDALAVDRSSRIPFFGVEDRMRFDLERISRQFCNLVDRYIKGDGRQTLDALRHLRNKRLAHRPNAEDVSGPDATDAEIENFYQDVSEMVRLLMTLVLATAYDPKDAAEVHRTYASFFWDGVAGETTEWHPRYKARMPAMRREV